MKDNYAHPDTARQPVLRPRPEPGRATATMRIRAATYVQTNGPTGHRPRPQSTEYLHGRVADGGEAGGTTAGRQVGESGGAGRHALPQGTAEASRQVRCRRSGRLSRRPGLTRAGGSDPAGVPSGKSVLPDPGETRRYQVMLDNDALFL